MIKTFIEELPFQLGQQLQTEFHSRLSEIKFLTNGNYNYYTVLGEYLDTVQTLLAMSIFYKRIITNLDSATKFSGRILAEDNCQGVLIGTYLLDAKANRQILKLQISFNQIMDEYSIPTDLFQYLETKEFLRKVKRLFIKTQGNAEPI